MAPFPVEVRHARLGDVLAMSRLYRSASLTDRNFYHPWPLDPLRLALELAVLVGVGYVTRRLGPRSGVGRFAIIVARDTSGRALVGFGSFRLRRSANGTWVARTGLIVETAWRRRCVGRALKVQLLDIARQLGATSAEAFLNPENTASVALNASLGLRIRDVARSDRAPPDVGRWIAEVSLLGREASEPDGTDPSSVGSPHSA